MPSDNHLGKYCAADGTQLYDGHCSSVSTKRVSHAFV
jgi:hypothetical protein